VFGRLDEPARRAGIIGTAALSTGAEHREIVHGLHVALLGGALIPDARPAEVLLHAEAALIERADAILSLGEALCGRALIPADGFLEVLVRAFALAKPRRNLELRRSIAGSCREPERQRTDGRGRKV